MLDKLGLSPTYVHFYNLPKPIYYLPTYKYFFNNNSKK
jgi:hypothetical protein